MTDTPEGRRPLVTVEMVTEFNAYDISELCDATEEAIDANTDCFSEHEGNADHDGDCHSVKSRLSLTELGRDCQSVYFGVVVPARVSLVEMGDLCLIVLTLDPFLVDQVQHDQEYCDKRSACDIGPNAKAVSTACNMATLAQNDEWNHHDDSHDNRYRDNILHETQMIKPHAEDGRSIGTGQYISITGEFPGDCRPEPKF